MAMSPLEADACTAQSALAVRSQLGLLKSISGWLISGVVVHSDPQCPPDKSMKYQGMHTVWAGWSPVHRKTLQVEQPGRVRDADLADQLPMRRLNHRPVTFCVIKTASTTAMNVPGPRAVPEDETACPVLSYLRRPIFD